MTCDKLPGECLQISLEAMAARIEFLENEVARLRVKISIAIEFLDDKTNRMREAMNETV